jgi:hypothetical protein
VGVCLALAAALALAVLLVDLVVDANDMDLILGDSVGLFEAG